MNTSSFMHLLLTGLFAACVATGAWSAPEPTEASSTPARYPKLVAKPESVGGVEMQQYYVGRKRIPLAEAYSSIVDRWQIGDSDVYLVSLSNGGSACAALYAFVAVSKERALVSETTGNCSDLATQKRVGNRILLSFPRMSRTNPASIVEYDNGAVFEGKKKVATTSTKLP